MNIHDVVTKLLIEQPYFGYIAASVSLVETSKVDTIRMASVPDMVIYYNPQWFDSLTEDYKIGAVIHELLHVILLHQFRRGSREIILWSVACDMAVNEMLPAKYISKEAVTVKAVSDKIKRRLEPGKNAEYYYDIITDVDDAPSFAGIDGDSILIFEGKNSLKATKLSEEAASDPELAALKHELYQSLEEAGSEGGIPAELSDSVGEVYSDLKLNWRIILKRFLTGRGRIVVRKSYKRQSRRYDNLPGTKRSVGVNALLALDESGSIPDSLVGEFYGELQNINKITGVKVLVTRFDTECTEPVPLNKFIINNKREKRGGTDFRPVFKLADELKVPLVIIFTDGDGKVPESANQKTLWVLTKNAAKPAAFGFAVNFE